MPTDPQSHTPSSSEVQQLVELRMIVEDAWWIVDTALSLQSAPEREASVVARCLYPHFARVVYESDRYLTRLDPSIADQLIDQQYRPQIEAARHSTKLFDDTKRGLADLVLWFDSASTTHRDRFGGSILAQLLGGADLAVSTLDRKLVTTSLVANFCLGVTPEELLTSDSQQELMLGMSAVLGQFAGGVVRAFSGGDVPDPTLDLGHIGVASTQAEEDVRAADYYSQRYESTFPDGLKAALTAMESSAQSAISILAATELGHEDTVFRARLVVASHLVSSLQKLVAEYAQWISDRAMKQITDLLDGEAAMRVKQRRTRAVRNIAMHYDLARPFSGLDVAQPMSRLVESLVPSTSYEQLSVDALTVCERSALLLREWRP